MRAHFSALSMCAVSSVLRAAALKLSELPNFSDADFSPYVIVEFVVSLWNTLCFIYFDVDDIYL